MGKRFLDKDRDGPELVRRYQDGESLSELAAGLGCNGGTVGNFLRCLGVTLRTRGWSKPQKRPADAETIPEKTRKAIVERYLSGVSIRNVGLEFGLGTHRTRACLLQSGVQIRPRNSIRIELDSESMVTLYLNGMSLRYLAAEFDTTVSTVKDRLLEAGVVLRTASTPPFRVRPNGPLA